MRAISETLLAAQMAPSKIPYVRVEARNDWGGVVKPLWEQIAYNSTTDAPLAMAITESGADTFMVRLRINNSTATRQLYRQRIINPAAGSGFGSWTETGITKVYAIACCANSAEVSLFWVKQNDVTPTLYEVWHQQSNDYGASWGTASMLYYAPTQGPFSLAAAYKPNGDCALFLGDNSAIYLIKRVSGSWQGPMAWSNVTGELAGLATIYDGDWKLLVSGEDTDGHYHVWTTIYGDGGEWTAGEWADLKAIASAPSDGYFSFKTVALDKVGVYRAYFLEYFNGANQTYWAYESHNLAGTAFLDSRFVEPVSFNNAAQYGLAVGHSSQYMYLSTPARVYRATLTETLVDLTADVLAVRAEMEESSGKLTVELDNSKLQYTPEISPWNIPAGLNTGYRIDLSPGYWTSLGNEVSSGLSFILESYEHVSEPGKGTVILHALDGWNCIENWIARYQFRWNKDGAEEANVLEILEQVLARASIKLEVISNSVTVNEFYPDFTIQPGENGREVITKLLSFIPDVIFLEGTTAYLIDTHYDDAPVYAYNQYHPILEGRYKTKGWKLNRFQTEGWDISQSKPIICNEYNWTQINQFGDRLQMVEDPNLKTYTEALRRAGAHWRKEQMQANGGFIRIPVNVGQQIYDVVEITDIRAGITEDWYRVMGIRLSYVPRKAEYEQVLMLGEQCWEGGDPE